MGNSIIGILGYGGAVGRVACDILKKEWRIRGGQRRAPQSKDADGLFQTMRVDVHDRDSLTRFCEGCRVVLNCVGPSYLIGDIVAQAAMRANAAYVDVFGGEVLERQLLDKGIDRDGLFVIGAGAFPGLSALLPRWMLGQGFDSVDRFVGYAGGREYCSWGAGADMLLSSVAGFGTPDSIWTDGRVKKISGDWSSLQSVPGFKGDVIAQPFLHCESIAFAQKYGVQEVRWFSVLPDEVIMAAVSRGCARLIESGPDILDDIVGELMQTASLSMSGHRSWYTLMVEVSGIGKGERLCKRAVLKSENSYELSGIIAAEVTSHLMNGKTENGVYWAFEVVEPARAIKHVRTAASTESLTVVEVAEAVENEAGVLETGVL